MWSPLTSYKLGGSVAEHSQINKARWKKTYSLICAGFTVNMIVLYPNQFSVHHNLDDVVELQ
jgi:hypothetical protein